MHHPRQTLECVPAIYQNSRGLGNLGQAPLNFILPVLIRLLGRCLDKFVPLDLLENREKNDRVLLQLKE